MIPGVRLVRRLALSLVILIALFAVANIWLERAAESRLGSAVQTAFGLDREPSVDLRVFPIVTRIFSGRLPEVSFEAADVTLEDLRLRLVRVRLLEVRLAGGLIGGGALTVAVDEGSVSAEVTQAAVNRLLRARDERATVRLREGSVRVIAVRPILGRDRRIVARGRLALKKGTLGFTARRVTVDGDPPPPGFEEQAKREASWSIRLPELPGGFRADAIELGDRMVTLRATLSDQEIELTR